MSVARALARPLVCSATLKLEREPSSRITSRRIDRCTSPVRRQPTSTSNTTENSTEATKGMLVTVGTRSISAVMVIAWGLRRIVGRSFSS